MKNRLLTFAGALALLAVLGRFYAVPVLAQVRAALVKNIDERGRTPYGQTASCFTAGSTVCPAIFPAVPANKRLVIEHVNGYVGVGTPGSLLSLAALQGNNLLVHYIFFQVQGSDQFNNTIYIANQPTLAYFEAGQTPNFFVGIKPSAVIFDQLTITGYLVDLTQ
jgi:hypothetical protein